jgi:hypothetical protein
VAGNKRPDFWTDAERQAYDKTPKWALWNALRDCCMLTDIADVFPNEDVSCDDTDKTIAKMLGALRQAKERDETR